MIVSRSKFFEVVQKLQKPDYYGFDTETTGLNPFKNDRAFCLIIATTEGETYYFNFHEDSKFIDYPCESELILDDYHWKELRKVFHVERSYWFAHNLKFDAHMLEKEGIEIKGKTHCTMAMERVYYNLTLGFSLDDCAKRRGMEKDSAVEDYIKDNKCYTWETLPGAKKRSKNLHYDMVPMDIIVPYGEKDALLTLKIGLDQIESLRTQKENWPTHLKSPWDIYQNELKVTEHLIKMEHNGMLIDQQYCKDAIQHFDRERSNAEGDFFELTGEDFVDSGKALAPIFDKMGLPYPMTEKGRPSFKESELVKLDHDLCRSILKIKKAEKKANTYFRNFLYYCDHAGYIHPSIRQEGAKTARMSCRAPNLQNVPQRGEDFSKYPVRGAFIAPYGEILCAVDYDQVEYRVMLDYAGQMDLIDKIKSGYDVHAATGEKVGVSRSKAKAINFGILYGIGDAEFARELGITIYEAKSLKAEYFGALPDVHRFIVNVKKRARDSGYVFNGMGRKNHLPKVPGRKMDYVMVNHLIQGYCADIMKKALWLCGEYLEANRCRSRMVLTVHDELLFYIHPEEMDIIPKLKHLMESAYDYRYLPLTCSAEISSTSWHDKKPWVAGGEKT